jgi:2-(1,2-epoxy-1,2-dihydrophenyl)acetyl-CoA isomerase
MSTILYKKINEVIATVTFNRPTAMNSLDHVMAEEFLNVVIEIEKDPAIRVVILQGMGDQFMAGGDIGFFYQHLNSINEQSQQMIEQVHSITRKLMSLPKMILASVHGAVAGIGISFMLAADLVIASENTKFTMAYSAIGASPDGGVTYHLPRLVGSKKAMEYLLFSERFTAADAAHHGLINWVVSEEERETKTFNMAQRLASGPQVSFCNIKSLVRNSSEHSLDQQLSLEEKYFVAAASTPDFATGVTAFVKKQKPEFI